jgi:AcrR family transcriptional regulator
MALPKANTEDTRKRILEAALNLFSDKGFYATTTRKIAEKAEVNEVTLFRHFKSKAILFQEVLNDIELLGFDTEALVRDLDISPEDLIRLAVEFSFEINEKNPSASRLLTKALLDNVEGFEEDYVNKHRNDAINVLSEAFEKLQAENKITSKEPPDLLAQMLLSQTYEMAIQRVIVHSSPLKKYDRKTVCDAIINLYLS